MMHPIVRERLNGGMPADFVALITHNAVQCYQHRLAEGGNTNHGYITIGDWADGTAVHNDYDSEINNLDQLFDCMNRDSILGIILDRLDYEEIDPIFEQVAKLATPLDFFGNSKKRPVTTKLPRQNRPFR